MHTDRCRQSEQGPPQGQGSQAARPTLRAKAAAQCGTGRCGLVLGDVCVCGSLWSGVGQCRAVCVSAGPCGSVRGGVGRCGAVWVSVERSGLVWGGVGQWVSVCSGCGA